MRALVPSGYSPKRHIARLAALTLSPLAPLAYAMVTLGVSLWAALAVPVGFVIGNLVEYIAHRFPMHRPWFNGSMYKRHAGAHHSMFRSDAMVATDPRDLHYVMMPIAPAAAFMLVVGGISGIASLLGWTTFAVPLCATLCAYIFMEELLHMSYHVGWTWRGGKWYHAMLRRLAAHHRVHHDPHVMRTVAFNVTVPLFDVVLGTMPEAGKPIGL